MKYIRPICIALYALMFLFTFGYSCAHGEPPGTSKFSDGSIVSNVDFRPVGGMIAGTLWSFYWSWELQTWKNTTA